MKTGWMTRIKALLAASVAGGVSLSLAFVVVAAFSVQGPAGGSLVSDYLGIAPVLLIVFIPAYLIGLAIVGLPAWMIVEATGVRSRLAAILMGAVLSAGTVVTFMLSTGLDAPESVAWMASLLAVSGAVAGWTLHRVAYGSTPKP